MIAPPLRVLACCRGVVAFGGLERMLFEALGAVRAAGGEVHCLVNTWNHRRAVEAAEAIGATWSTGAYRQRLPRRPGGVRGALRHGWDVVRSSLALLAAVRRFRPTHVLVPEFGLVVSNLPAMIALRVAGPPVLLMVQNAPAAGPFYRRVWRRAVDPWVTRYVCASETCRDALVAHGIARARATVVHNFPPRPAAEAPVPRETGRIVYVGQIIPQKGLDLLLDAAGLLVARGCDVRVDVVGDHRAWVAPEYRAFRDALAARSAAPDLADRVRYLGWRDDVPAVIAGAMVHCMPSRPEMHEGLPLAVLEAKRAGVPTVAFALGPFPELIRHGVDGWLVPEVSAGALADGLERCLSAGVPAEAAARIRRSAEPFTREAFSAGWLAVLREGRGTGEAARARGVAAPAARGRVEPGA